jgi:Icc-related predicted phosphoesterase
VLVDEPHSLGQPREEAEEQLLERLHGLAAQLDPNLTTIFNLHCPPHGTMLDRAPQLTADLKVVLDGGEPRIVPVGSTAVRTLIAEVQPVLSLHGHIHESKAVAKIERRPASTPAAPTPRA